MSKLLMILLLVVGSSSAQVEDQAIADAKAKIAMKMKDPESARFTDLVAVDNGKGPTVCGWINAKNSYGGYVGYKPFFVMGKIAQVRDDASDSIINNHIIFDSIWSICSPNTGESFGTDIVDLPKINVEKHCAKVSKAVGKPLGYDCPKAEIDAKIWLEAHGTSSWIASKCGRAARRADSYISAKSCVQNGEAEIIFSRGPRIERSAQ